MHPDAPNLSPADLAARHRHATDNHHTAAVKPPHEWFTTWSLPLAVIDDDHLHALLEDFRSRAADGTPRELASTNSGEMPGERVEPGRGIEPRTCSLRGRTHPAPC